MQIVVISNIVPDSESLNADVQVYHWSV